MWYQLFTATISSSLLVAILNHFSLTWRNKNQREFENKSFVMKEKLKVLNELENEFKEFAHVTSTIYIELKKYMNSELEDYDKEKQKIKLIRKTIEQSQINSPDYLGNIMVHLNYFPNIKNTIYDNNLFGKQSKVIKVFWTAENENEKYYKKRMNGIKDENIEQKLLTYFEEYNKSLINVRNAMNSEVSVILEYLEKK